MVRTVGRAKELKVNRVLTMFEEDEVLSPFLNAAARMVLKE
jgi:hypothetical protein